MKTLLVPLDFHRHKEDDRLFLDMQLAFHQYGECMMYEGNVDQAIAYKPDLVFYQGSVDHEDCLKIKMETKCKWATWTGDVRYAPMQYLMQARAFTDVFFFPFSGNLLSNYRKLLKTRCVFIFEPIQEWRYVAPKYLAEGPVSFVGNVYTHLPGGDVRNELQSFVSAGHHKLDLYGEGMERGKIDKYLVPEIYNNSFAGIAENNWSDIDSYFTPRNLSIMAAGSCCLAKTFPGIQYHFTSWVDCVYYNDKYELIDVIAFLKANPGVRNEIARNGHEHVLSNYNMTIFAKKFIEAL